MKDKRARREHLHDNLVLVKSNGVPCFKKRTGPGEKNTNETKEVPRGINQQPPGNKGFDGLESVAELTLT